MGRKADCERLLLLLLLFKLAMAHCMVQISGLERSCRCKAKRPRHRQTLIPAPACRLCSAPHISPRAPPPTLLGLSAHAGARSSPGLAPAPAPRLLLGGVAPPRILPPPLCLAVSAPACLPAEPQRGSQKRGGAGVCHAQLALAHRRASALAAPPLPDRLGQTLLLRGGHWLLGSAGGRAGWLAGSWLSPAALPGVPDGAVNFSCRRKQPRVEAAPLVLPRGCCEDGAGRVRSWQSRGRLRPADLHPTTPHDPPDGFLGKAGRGWRSGA